MVVRPSTRHGNILERLKNSFELERKHHELILEEAMETAAASCECSLSVSLLIIEMVQFLIVDFCS